MISRAFSTAVKSGRGTARRVWHQNTLAQHADHLYSGADTFGDVAPPISMTTTFEKRSHRGESEGFAYSRDGRPTVSQAEAIIGKLEGGHAVLFASGQAATFSALTHFKPKRVFVTGGYHGTHQAIDLLTDLGVIEEKCELPDNMLEQEFREGDLLWIESPRNPNCVITDIADARYIADRSGVDVKVVVDSTFAPPPLQQCLDLGAHAVMHSSTKYFSGHSDALGGILAVPTEEEKQALVDQRAILGSQPGSLEAWLLIRSCRTLGIRVAQQCSTAQKLAHWLEEHPAVAHVAHPSLASHPQHEIAERQMPGGYGAVINITMRTDEQVESLLNSTKLFKYATSLGG
eukprot:CAMPEP_0195510606 /NCGR_PEP_ID=MMETSP0794_2-20130614/3205_1 /TAXON_ID=515487 /ORGANISM="Stephanopyxis turris, Strain CCMP 815" /LENGTH=345 /DNA_ID=CAMNT_0040638059 /DNA_START=50 /DNA_END=1084 /DNA_ORIENTATION=+